MAFETSTFIKEASKHTLEELLYSEKFSMKAALAGDEQLNSGVSGSAQLEGVYLVLKWILRDTMVRGFMSAFSSEDDSHPPLEEFHEATHALLQMALMMTENKTA